MTKAEIIQIIRDRLGFNEGLVESAITRHLALVQSRYEGGDSRTPLPWFLFTTTTLSTAASTRTVAAPSDFIGFDDDWLLTIEDDEGVEHPLHRWAPYAAPLKDKLAVSGFPEVFAFQNKTLYLYPEPDDSYTINFPYYARSESLATATTSDWFTEFPSLLIEETVLSLAKSVRDEAAIQLTNVRVERDDYFVRCEAMKHQLQSYVSGSVDG